MHYFLSPLWLVVRCSRAAAKLNCNRTPPQQSGPAHLPPRRSAWLRGPRLGWGPPLAAGWAAASASRRHPVWTGGRGLVARHLLECGQAQDIEIGWWLHDRIPCCSASTPCRDSTLLLFCSI